MEGLSCAQPSHAAAAAAGLLIMGWWNVFGAQACWQQRVCVCVSVGVWPVNAVCQSTGMSCRCGPAEQSLVLPRRLPGCTMSGRSCWCGSVPSLCLSCHVLCHGLYWHLLAHASALPLVVLYLVVLQAYRDMLEGVS